MVDPIDRNELLEYVWRCRLDSRERIDELVRSMPTLPYAQSEPLKIIIDHEPMADELERIKQAMRNTPVMLLPSAQPSFSQPHENDHVADDSKKVVPCEDAVSRKDVVKFFDDWMSALDTNCHYQSMADLKIIKNDFENLPSAQPEQRWIPVTERLPKNREWVLGIFQEGDTGWINPIPFICDYVGNKTPITTQDNWLLKLVDEPHPYYENLHCIAWMPLPETWEEGEQG